MDTSNIENMPFNYEIAVFEKLGFKIKSKKDFYENIDYWLENEIINKDSDKPQFSILYFILSTNSQFLPNSPLTDNCFSLDTERFESADIVKEILINMGRITRGEINVTNVEDKITYHDETDTETGEISFNIGKDEYKWDIKMSGYRVSPEMISDICSLTIKYKTKGRFTYYAGESGIDFIIGFETPENFEKIKNLTKIDLNWLD